MDMSVLCYHITYVCNDSVCFLTGQTQRQFDEFFRKTAWGGYIAKAEPEMQTEFFQRYLQDFISMTMTVTCEEDLQVVCLSEAF